MITLAREHGALGSLAEKIAEQLGFKLWNRELLEAIATEIGIDDARLADNDERAHSRLDETLTDWILGADRSQTHYFATLRGIVRAIAREGSAIIVCRGANFILPPDKTLRVRVVAPLEARAAAIAAQKNISLREARHEARQVDHDREAFIRRSFRKNARDPTEYDVVVNTGSMPAEVVARVVADCYRDRFGDPRRVHGAAQPAAHGP